MEAYRVRVVVTGKVQGVSYRAHAADAAKRLGVVGWVHNRIDGSVEVEAQGAQAAVEAFIAWCRVGPRAAQVTGVEIAPIPAIKGECEFRVRG